MARSQREDWAEPETTIGQSKVLSYVRNFDAAHGPALADVYTSAPIFTGDRIVRWNALLRAGCRRG